MRSPLVRAGESYAQPNVLRSFQIAANLRYDRHRVVHVYGSSNLTALVRGASHARSELV